MLSGNSPVNHETTASSASTQQAPPKSPLDGDEFRPGRTPEIAGRPPPQLDLALQRASSKE